jgi:hypothetical protein
MLLIAVLLACRFDPAPPPHHVGILIDRSYSVPVTDRRTLARKLAATGAAIPGVDSRATLVLFATGDGSRSLLMLGQFEMPIRPVGGDRQALAAAERAGLILRVTEAAETIEPVGTSPLYLSVGEAVAELRRLGCGAQMPCTLLVASDLQEGAEPEIRARLAGRTARLPQPIDATGLSVEVCGLGSTTDPAGGRLDATLRSRTEGVWTELVANAEHLVFQPTCGVSGG